MFWGLVVITVTASGGGNAFILVEPSIQRAVIGAKLYDDAAEVPWETGERFEDDLRRRVCPELPVMLPFSLFSCQQ